jgi:hypothetical protein
MLPKVKPKKSDNIYKVDPLPTKYLVPVLKQAVQTTAKTQTASQSCKNTRCSTRSYSTAGRSPASVSSSRCLALRRIHALLATVVALGRSSLLGVSRRLRGAVVICILPRAWWCGSALWRIIGSGVIVRLLRVLGRFTLMAMLVCWLRSGLRRGFLRISVPL